MLHCRCLCKSAQQTSCCYVCDICHSKRLVGLAYNCGSTCLQGGGAFLIPYFFFLVTTGLPLLQAELALGARRPALDCWFVCSIHVQLAICVRSTGDSEAAQILSSGRRAVVCNAGRLFQKGDVMAFGSIHKRARGVGAISAVGGFAVGAPSPCITWQLRCA